MNIAGAGASGVSGNWNIGHQQQANQTLSPEVQNILSQNFGFKGTKIVKVETGTEAIQESMEIQYDVNDDIHQLVQQEVAEALGITENIDSVLVMVGGAALVSEELEKLKKKLKKMDEERASRLSQKLGLAGENEIMVLVSSGDGIQSGGLLIVKSGLGEIEDTL